MYKDFLSFVITGILLITGCSLNDDVAGGTTDSGNAIVAGSVVKQGVPVVAAKVSIRPADFQFGDDSTEGVKDTVTDVSGTFSLSVPEGTDYTVTVHFADTLGARLQNIDVGDASSDTLNFSLTPKGGLSGSIPGVNGGEVYLKGSDLTSSIDSHGGFFFPKLAEGTYDILIKGSSGDSIVLKHAPVVSSEIQVLYNISPSLATWDSPKVGTYSADSLLVSQFLQASITLSEISVDSVIQVSGGRIRTLDLRNLQMTQLNPAIERLTFLDVLDLTSNQLTTLPQELGTLRRLSYLIADSNALDTLPGALADLKNLQYLKLSHNALHALPDSYYTFPKLIKLGIGANPLDSLPEALGQLTTLELLDIYSCGLTQLPESIGSLTQLKELWASDNKLTRLPQSMSNLTSLHTLQLTFNEIGDIDFAIDALTRLTYLDLYSNNLTSLPEAITTLKPIEKLVVGKNFLCNESEARVTWLTAYAGGDWLSQQNNCQ
ncbi:MAG: hypothetical protein OCD01_09760 [Fibrobacterales bacterium]